MIYLGIVSVIWAFSFGLIGNSLAGVDSFFTSSIRLACATLIFLPWLRLKSINRKESIKLIRLGFIQFGIMYVSYMKAFFYLPSHLVALFSIFTPLYVVFIHDIQRHMLSKKFLFAAILSVMGAYLIKAKEIPSGDFLIGFLLMQLAGASFAYGQVAYKDWKIRNSRVKDREVFSMLVFGGFLCAMLFSFFWTDWTSLEISPNQWKSLIYLGCIASGLGFFLWNKGATQTNHGILAAFNNAVVPLAVLCSLFIFGEARELTTDTSIRLSMGSFLIFSSILICKKNLWLRSKNQG